MTNNETLSQECNIDLFGASFVSPRLVIYKKPSLLASCKTHLAKDKYSALHLEQSIMQYVTMNSEE
jgi:hypothetical protein